MTVSYQYEVASSTSGGFTRLLFMWKGSLYKLIYRELLLFLLAFGILSALYRNLFTVDQKRLFEKVVVYCDTFINLIPLSFVLGFYVAYVAARWWNQYLAIPWPDKLMHSIALYVQGNDDHARMIRRNLMRYLNLTLILVLRSISSAVKRRFPKLDHLVEAGFMTHTELGMYQSVPSLEFNTYWIPCTWFIHLLRETRRSNRIADPQGLKLIMEEFNEYRSQCGMLWSYDWVSIPLVYTQVVTIATYSFFLAALVGRQYVDEDRKSFQMEIDIYLPVFTILQFFFYMGLLKVAEQLINPFGDDDEDFELNWLIDRHTKVSYLGVDTLMTRCPPLVKDMYYNEVDLTLPYTEAAVAYKRKTYRGSVHNMVVPEEQHAMFLPEIEEEDEAASSGTRTPKTSILSLHKAGLPNQNQQQDSGAHSGAHSGASSAASKGLKSVAGIWRRNSDKSRKGDNAVSGSGPGPPAARRGDGAGGGPGSGAAGGSGPSAGSRGSAASTFSMEAEHPDGGGGRHVFRNESFHSWKSFISNVTVSAPGSGPGSHRDRDSSSPSPSVGTGNSNGSVASSEDEDDDEQQAAARAVAVEVGPRSSHSSSGSSGTQAGSTAGSTGGSGRIKARRDSTPSSSPRPGRPRLQSCPKLLVLLGRNDSTSSASRDGRKKGVRWKPVLDESRASTSAWQRERRGSDMDAEEAPPGAYLCAGCRERLRPLLDRPGPGPGAVHALRRPTVRRRPRGARGADDEPEMLGSAPDLGAAAALDFVRDDSYWRGGKFPGTSSGLAYGQRSGSRGILKKMMFWRGAAVDGVPGAHGALGVGGGVGDGAAGSANVMESVIVTVEPLPVSRSLPDIAATQARTSMTCVSSLPSLPGFPDEPQGGHRESQDSAILPGTMRPEPPPPLGGPATSARPQPEL